MSAAAILEARGLTRQYRVGRGLLGPPAILRAVDEVSLSLRPGATLAMVGESGCGKTTLGRLLTMIERPDEGGVLIDGREVVAADRARLRALRQDVQIVFQDPYGSLNPRKKVGAILEEPLVINTGMAAAARRDRALEMLARVGLRPEHYGRYPHMFSGGQRQRIAIARALMPGPRVLVADEPVSALDISIQAQVLNLLMDLKDELSLALLFISHDLAVVRHIADDVMVMYLGRVVEEGPAPALFTRPRHPYTMALLASTPAVDPALRRAHIPLAGEPPSPLAPPPGCTFHTRCPHATKLCRRERPALRALGEGKVACHHAEDL